MKPCQGYYPDGRLLKPEGPLKRSGDFDPEDPHGPVCPDFGPDPSI